MSLLTFFGIFPAMPPKKPSRPPASKTGWVITPRTIGTLVTLCALAAALWKPIEVGTKLAASIDNLSSAVSQLQTVMKEQGQDISMLKAKVSGFDQLKDARSQQLLSIEQRLQAVEARK